MNRTAGPSQRLGPWQIALAFGLAASLIPGACRSKSSPKSSSTRERTLGGGNAQRRLGDGMKGLMDSIDNPGAGFHISYKAQENINSKYAQDANAKPEVGPVEIEADLTSDEVNVTETRGTKKTETKANKTDEIGWPMAKLAVMGALLDPNFALAFGGMAARPASSETVGGTATDKVEFDTSKIATAKAGLEIAGGLLGGKAKFSSVKGTAWLDQATGRLVKFNIETELTDKAGNSWKEHHEAVVTPK